MIHKIIPCIYGRAGSGKSTIIAALAMFCRQHLAYEDNLENPAGFQLLDKWVRALEESGLFPPATPVTTFQQVDFGFRTEEEQRVRLHFLEVAGENLRLLDPGSNAEIPAELGAWLRHFNRLLIVLPFDAKGDDIDASCRFLELAHRLKPGVPTCVVRSKWDKVSEGQHGNLSRRFARVSNLLRSLESDYGDGFASIDFSVGTVKRDADSTRLERFVSEHGTEKLLKWIFQPEEF